MKLLIVEDGTDALRVMKYGLKAALSKSHPDYECDIARGYHQVEDFVKKNLYDLVLLDHNLPYDDQTALEYTDERKYSDLLCPVGYTLIDVIRRRSPSTIIIGTSSGDPCELRGFPEPDYRMGKGQIKEELGRILEERF